MIARSKLSQSKHIALPTLSNALAVFLCAYASILGTPVMPVLASSSCQFGFSGGSLGDDGHHASPDVLGVRDGLQVPRIDAPTVAAEMIQFEPFGNRADVLLVGEAVSRDDGHAALPLESSVSGAVLRAEPIPADISGQRNGAYVSVKYNEWIASNGASRHGSSYLKTVRFGMERKY